MEILRMLRASLLLLTLTIAGCAVAPEKIPVAASCPQPPQVPAVLKGSVTTEPTLLAQYQVLIQALQDFLKKEIPQ